MSGTILFKFRNARGEPESVSFDGIHITALELKNLIAEKKGLTDSTLELSDPKTKAIYDDNHVFPRGSAVTVRRVAASKAHTRAQQNVTAADITEEVAAGPAMAALQTLAATRAPAASAVHAGDESAQLEQRKANQDKEDAEIGLLVSAQDEAWRAQSDKNILATRAREQQLAAQRGRGRGFGGSFMHGRGRGGQPTGFCKFCGKMNDHFSEDCPQKHNPRTDLRHVRAPAGIPSELLEQSSEGGLLLHTGKTGALKASTGLAAQAFAALPTAAKKGQALPALANAPHEEQQQPLLLGNGNQQKHGDEEDDAEAAGLDSLVQDEASQQEPSAVAAADGDKGPAGTPAVAADIDTDDAYLFDDDFGFGNPDGNTAATDLFEEVEGLPADISGAVQLKLGVGMELPEPEQPEPESLQRHQQSRSPLSQHMQESSVSPLSQPAGHKQQQSPAQHMDKTEDATGLSPVDPLRYCSDIILASIPGSRRWVPKDIRQAFIQDRPLTPDEFFALMERYKAAAPVVMQQQNELKQAPQRQEDSSRRRMKEAGSRRRSRSRSRERSRSLSRSQSRDRAGSKRQRKAEKSPRSHRSRSRSRSRDRHRGSRHRRDRPRDRSRDEQSKSAAASDRAGREHQQERAPRTTAERSASTTLDAGSDKESAGGADQALDRPHDLTTAGPSQDLVGLLEPEDEQQPQPAGAATTAGEAAATAREEPRTEPAHDKVPAAAAATSPEVDTPVKRRPISSRLGPQPRSPVRSASPEHQPQQQQEDLQQADDKTAQTSDAVKPMRSKSGTRSVSRGRSSSRSLSESSGSRGDKKRRSRSRSRTSHSSGQRQKSDNGPAVQDEELLDFGDEDEAIETAVAAEDSQVSDEKHSEKHHRNSKRRTRHSSRKRSKREKKERKEKSGKKKRHRSDRHRSRSRSREGNRRHSQSRSRSTSRSHSRSRSRSRSRGRHRGRSSRHPEIVDRVNSKQDRHADQPANNRESVTTRLGSKAAAEDSVVFTRSGSGRIADAGKRPAPGFGAGRLLGRAFQGLGDAQASRAAEGAKRARR